MIRLHLSVSLKTMMMCHWHASGRYTVPLRARYQCRLVGMVIKSNFYSFSLMAHHSFHESDKHADRFRTFLAIRQFPRCLLFDKTAWIDLICHQSLLQRQVDNLLFPYSQSSTLVSKDGDVQIMVQASSISCVWIGAQFLYRHFTMYTETLHTLWSTLDLLLRAPFGLKLTPTSLYDVPGSMCSAFWWATGARRHGHAAYSVPVNQQPVWGLC